MCTRSPDVAVDNDVLIKTACYGLTEQLLGSDLAGVLGAAKYVVAGRISKMELAGDSAAAQDAAAAVIRRSTILEPTDEELSLATEIETVAQRRSLELDAGESQLAAMVIVRSIPFLETGDKRAIRGFEALLPVVAELAALRGRLRCLEQMVQRYADTGHDPDELTRAICSEPDVDKTLSICFRCYSPPPHGTAIDRAALDSYVVALRAAAPNVLTP
jgi:hypothetical protein